MKNQNVHDNIEKAKRLILNLNINNLQDPKIMNSVVDLKIAIDEMFNLIKPNARPLFMRTMVGAKSE